MTRDGAVERFFQTLIERDWDAFHALLAVDVARVGPQGERLVGRDEYVEYMTGTASAPDGTQQTTWDIHSVGYGADGRSAFARVTAHIPQWDLHFEETLAFVIGAEGLISLIEVFWRDPNAEPAS